MGTWLNILSQEETHNIQNYVVKDDRFRIDKDESVFLHLRSMFNNYVSLTNKVIIGGEEIISNDEIKILCELLTNELTKLNMIFLDRWEFQINPTVKKLVDGKQLEPGTFDPTKAYLAEKSVLDGKYEIRKGHLGNIELLVEKKWLSVRKSDIKEYLNEFINICEEAIEKNEVLYFTYW